MSPMETNSTGGQYWRARMDEKYETRENINLGHQNSEQAYLNSIKGVARMMEMKNDEIISDEEMEKCLGYNCEKLNIEREELVQKALKMLESSKEEE